MGGFRLEGRESSGQCPVMDRMLTPQQAADRAGCGRSSVMRALKSGRLPGIRDNENRWQIDPDAVDRWAGQRPDIDRPETGQEPATPADSPETLARLAVAEARLADTLDRLTETQRDRDHWRDQAQALAHRPGLLARLLRRS
jgi:excisionase family DNA binding protein